MPTKPVLPPLHPRSGIGNVARGRWNDMGSDLVRQVAEALNVGGQPDVPDLMASVPDVWAQIFVAREALVDATHPAHNLVREQWRGLLALLAMAALRIKAPLEIGTVDLTYLSSPAGDYTRHHHQTGNRPTNLATLTQELGPGARPEGRHLKWDRLGVMVYQGQPVGLTVPDILVCPAVQTDLRADRDVRWISDGRMTDPCREDSFLPGDYPALVRYISNLLSAVEASVDLTGQGPGGITLSGLRRELKEYKDDVLALAGENGRPPEDWESIPIEPHPFRMPDQDIRKHLCYLPVSTGPVGDQVSDLAIPFRSDVAPDLKAIIVGQGMADDISSQWSLNPDRIRVWKNHSLWQYINNLSDRERSDIKTEANLEGYLILDENDLFLDDLVSVQAAQFSHNPPGFKHHFLPLTPLALMLIPHREIDRLRLPGEKLRLRLNMEDGSDDGREYIFEKDYTDNHVKLDISDARRLPIQTAWPDVDAGLPYHYYHYLARRNQISFQPVFPLNADIWRSLMNNVNDSQRADELRRASRALMAGSDAGLAKEVVDRAEGRYEDTRTGIFHTRRPAEACFYQARGGGRDIPAGVAIQPQPAAVDIQPGEMTLAVDLGSHNTSVYFSLNNGEPTPLDINPSRLLAYNVNLKNHNVRMSEVLTFLPVEELTTPFMTAMVRSEHYARRGTAPFLDERLYAANNDPEQDLGLIDSSSRVPGHRMLMDIKWDAQGETRASLKKFISQICLLALAKAASLGLDLNQVEWRFAYPEAMVDATPYRTAIQGAVEDVIGTEELRGHDALGRISFQPESIATANHFISRNANLAGTMLTLDVGGATTDACLWQEHRLIWHGSLLLGGQDVLISYLAHNPDTLESLIDKDGKLRKYLDQMVKLNSRDRNVMDKLTKQIRVLIHHPEFRTSVRRNWNEKDTRSHPLTHLTQITLAGLLYYLAGVMRAMAARPDFSLNVRPLQVLLGGRGSLMFKDFCFSSVSEERIAKYFMKLLGVKHQPEVLVEAGMAKHEVARGLLLDYQTPDTNRAVNQNLLGEELAVVSKTDPDVLLGADDSLSIKHLGERWLVRDLSVLNKFLERYASGEDDGGLDRRVDLTPAVEREIVVGTNQMLADQQRQIKGLKSDQQAALKNIQPPFILGLKLLVNNICRGKLD